MSDTAEAQAKKAREPIPFFAFGNAPVGVIAVGNAAFGVVAIGISVSCGVVAIGMNTVGVFSFGLINAGGPFSAALVNAIGVVTYALVNAFGGLGACLVNEGITPILGIVIAIGFFIGGTFVRVRRSIPEIDPSLVPLARLRELEPGTYSVRARVEQSADSVALVADDDKLAVELGEGNVPAAGAEVVGLRAFFEGLDGKLCDCTVAVVEEFEQGEGDYRSAPDKRRRLILQDGRVAPPYRWTRGDLAWVGVRSLQVGSLVAAALCVAAL